MRPAFGGPHRIAGETGRRGARRSRGMRSGFERGSSRIQAALDGAIASASVLGALPDAGTSRA
ncbi:hypothetical protein DO72_5990 [Burkholderia pseudomallei]|nr:hypothetical protein DO72_5990 [Burkholderia pseudomallei]